MAPRKSLWDVFSWRALQKLPSGSWCGSPWWVGWGVALSLSRAMSLSNDTSTRGGRFFAAKCCLLGVALPTVFSCLEGLWVTCWCLSCWGKLLLCIGIKSSITHKTPKPNFWLSLHHTQALDQLVGVPRCSPYPLCLHLDHHDSSHCLQVLLSLQIVSAIF